MDDPRPWYVDFTKEIGGLGLVLVMLVGLYFLGDRYLDRMSQTWEEILEVEKVEASQQKDHREHVLRTTTDFMATQGSRMTDHARRIGEIEDRVTLLENK